MIYKSIWLTALSLLLMCQVANAETKYVTDDLKLALHEMEGSKGKLLQRMQSGTKLEVLEVSGLFAKVRTPDGTVGWTKAGFLMSEIPARARLLELEQKQARLENTLQKTQDELSNSNKQASALRAEKIQTALELAGHKERQKKDRDSIEQLKQDNNELQERIQALQKTLPAGLNISWQWALAAVGFSLVIGLLVGLALFDWYSRKRHGGYRIY